MFSLNINHIHMILQKHVFYTTNYKQQKQKHKKMQLIKYAIFQNVQINDLHACLVQRPRTDSHWVTHCYLLISKWSHQYILACPQSLCTLYHSCIDVHVSCMYILCLFMIPWSYMSQRHPCIKDKNITWFIDRIFTHSPVHDSILN